MKKLVASDAQEKLAVADAKLGQVIKKKFELDCVFDSNVQELMRYVKLSEKRILFCFVLRRKTRAFFSGINH